MSHEQHPPTRPDPESANPETDEPNKDQIMNKFRFLTATEQHQFIQSVGSNDDEPSQQLIQSLLQTVVQQISQQQYGNSNEDRIRRNILLDYYKKDKTDKDWVINLLYQNSDFLTLVKLLGVDSTNKIDQNRLFNSITSCEDDRVVVDLLFERLKLFDKLDKNKVKAAIYDPYPGVILTNMQYFEIDKDKEKELYEHICSKENGLNLISLNLSRFTEESIIDAFAKDARAAGNNEALITGLQLLNKANNYSFEKKVEYVKDLCSEKMEDVLIDYLYRYGHDRGDLVGMEKQLKEVGAHATLFILRVLQAREQPNDAENKTEDEKDIAILIEKNSLTYLCKLISTNFIDKISSNLASYLLQNDQLNLIAQKIDKIDNTFLTEEVVDAYLTAGNINFIHVYTYYKILKNSKIDYIEKSFKLFGPHVSPIVTFAIKEILDDKVELSDHYTQIGITEKGTAGIEQLKAAIKDIREKLLGLSQNTDKQQYLDFIYLIKDSPIARAIAQQELRFQISEFGEHDQESWEKILNNHLQQVDKLFDLTREFNLSQIHNVLMLERESVPIDEGSKNVFIRLRDIISKAVSLCDGPVQEMDYIEILSGEVQENESKLNQGMYEALFSLAKDILEKKIAELLKKLDDAKGSEKRERIEKNINKQILALETTLGLTARDIISLFAPQNEQASRTFEDLEDQGLRSINDLILVGIITKSIQRSEKIRSICMKLQEAEVSLENISECINLITLISKTRYFNNALSKGFLRDLAKVKTLESLIKNNDNKTTTDRVSTLQIVPSNGLLLEFSGNIGDACWASKYGSIANEFPNITSLTFVRNPGQNTEKIVGSCLLIKTKDLTTQEEVYIVRAINPTQTYINDVDVENFIDCLVSYVRQNVTNIRVAVVIEKDSGGAATNRPSVAEYLSSIKGKMTSEDPIPKLDPNSTFNDRDLDGKAYYLKS